MDVFKAIADPRRREVIAILADNGPSTISLLSHHFAATRQATTKHLNILQAAGLLEIETTGRERLCSLNLDAMAEVKEWVDFYSDFWNRKLNSLSDFLGE